VSTSAVGFSIVSGNSFTLTAGATQTVTVHFSPPEAGTFSGTVTVSSNGGGASVTVSGVAPGGPKPALTVTPSILNFGMVRVGKSKDLSFTVQNTGEGTLAGMATATDPFSVVTNSSFTLDAGESLLVFVRFSPPTSGTFTGTVEFTSNGGDFTATVTGRGRGRLLPSSISAR